jgi:uncharacterized protein (DUF433 family)
MAAEGIEFSTGKNYPRIYTDLRRLPEKQGLGRVETRGGAMIQCQEEEEDPMKPVEIIDRGRGPEIAGTRVTAYDVYQYSIEGWHHTLIAAVLGISSNQVKAMLRYIDEHKEEVDAVHRQIEERNARGNPPEVEEKLKESRKKLQALKQRLWKEKETGGQSEGTRTHAMEVDPMKPVEIIDRGRGPEIAGTRVTAYDVYQYSIDGYHHTFIAAALGISSNQVIAMLRYIEEHKEEVDAVHRRIEERNARGNPPEIEEKVRRSRAHAIVQQRFEELRKQRSQEKNGEGNLE